MQLNREAAERNTAAFERLIEAFERHEHAFERHEEVFGRHEQAFGDLKQFICEITVRTERVHRGVVAELRELRDETRAQTKALLAVIDRLPPPPQTT